MSEPLGFTVSLKDVYDAVVNLREDQDVRLRKVEVQIAAQWVVIGIFIGALAAALLSGTFSLRFVPDMWRGRFGPGIGKRGVAAFVGGIVAMIGARLADG